MVRTQIQLSEEQVAVLKNMAESRQKSMAEIIRQAIDFFAKSQQGGVDQQRRERAMAVAGRFRSGIKDLAAEHDSYLAKIWGQ